MTNTNDLEFSPVLLHELYEQFLNQGEPRFETTSEIPTQRVDRQPVLELTPYPLFPIPSLESVLLKKGS
jgi:hypothetical protein